MQLIKLNSNWKKFFTFYVWKNLKWKCLSNEKLSTYIHITKIADLMKSKVLHNKNCLFNENFKKLCVTSISTKILILNKPTTTLRKFKKNQNSTFFVNFLTFLWFSSLHKKFHVPNNSIFWTVSYSNLCIYFREYLQRLHISENFW